jgi:hypothetical protein
MLHFSALFFFWNFGFIQTQFIDSDGGGYLAGVFFIIGFAFGQAFPIYYGSDGKQATAAFNAFVQGLKLQVLTIFIGPAV